LTNDYLRNTISLQEVGETGVDVSSIKPTKQLAQLTGVLF
jgi:hypothetical protein